MAVKKKKSNAAARQAHLKNVERAAVRARREKRQAFLAAHRKQLMIGIPALVVLLVGIWLLCKATIGPGGSIPNFFGHLQGVGEDWIVANQGTDASPRYYKMGTFAVPEGYVLDPDYTISTDPRVRTCYCTADSAEAPVQTVYVAGVQGKTAAEMIDSLAGYDLYSGGLSPQEGVFAGQQARWVVGLANDDHETVPAEGEELPLTIGHRQMTLYVDSVHGGCVLVYLNSAVNTPVENIPAEADFLAVAEKIVAGLTVE